MAQTSTRPRQATGRRNRRTATGAVVALTGLLLFAAVPWLLLAWRSDPLPHTWQPARWWTLARRGYLHPDVLPNSIAVLAWLVWTQLALALVRETAARLRRGATAARTGLLPGVVQHLAHTWITSLSLLLTLLASRAGAATAPLHLAAATATHTPAQTDPASTSPSPLGAPDAAPSATAVPVATTGSLPRYETYRSQPYDTLRSLAARRYGNPDLWAVIRDASIGVPQPDGTRLPAGLVSLTPGNILHIPALPDTAITVSAEPVADRTPASRTSTDHTDGDRTFASTTASHPVAPRENLWTIVDAAYPDLPDADTPAAVDAVFTANLGTADPLGRTLHDPGLVNPGMVLRLPTLHLAADGGWTPSTRPPSSTPTIPTPLETPTPPTDTDTDADGAAPGSLATPAAPSATSLTSPPAPPTTPPAASSAATAPASEPATTPHPATAPTVPTPPSHRHTSQSFVWLGAAGLLATVIVGSWTARRRRRDNHTTPQHVVPATEHDRAALHTALLDADDPDLLDRLDAALRTIASAHRDQPDGPHPQILLVHPDDLIEVFLHPHGTHALPPPWTESPDPQIWTLPPEAELPALDHLPPPCPALIQLGATPDGSGVFADLEALGSLGIDTGGDSDTLGDVARAILTTVAASPWADLTTVRTLGLDPHDLGEADRITVNDSLEDLVDATTADAHTLHGALDLGGYATTLTARVNEPGEEFDPTIALVAEPTSDDTGDALARLADLAGDGQRGIAALLPAHPDSPTRWALRPDPTHGPTAWRLDPLGLPLIPCGLSEPDAADLADLWADAEAPLAEQEPPPQAEAPHPFNPPPWRVMVRLLGPVDVIPRDGPPPDPTAARDRTGEVLAWLVTHRHGTRTDLETALWPRGATPKTIANALSRVRRLLIDLAGPDADGWLPRFERNGALALAPEVISDLDLLDARIRHAQQHHNHPDTAIAALQGAVDLIRGIPAGYPWLDAQMGSILTTTPVNAVILLAEHHLARGDTTAVLTTTTRGLEILPAHTELFALRLRAHAATGDTDAVKAEYRAYLRAEQAEPYWDGDTDRDLENLYRQLLRPHPEQRKNNRYNGIAS
ncbi:bacterial transcriptional activator domain-containing protein [Frankia sp. AiPs1]|uniref:bacterial transcriptional activator domain-containing protein n=1 Tax=Frankia sp. AiPs1 TaxID=573493 RepID=UPI00204402B9|nr:bacterial transcriptional activator domain-containing protein [Frankia sp. AiPs1]MCM3920271.1 bacterial transcriptional activator domain-containing protein [Frankia sp. AiPs1]